MKYLDYSRMDRILKTCFNQPGEKPLRMVGREKQYDSGYNDIVRFFGRDAVDPTSVEIAYLPGLFEFEDATIAEFSRHIEDRLSREGRLHEGPTIMKLVELDLRRQSKKMTVQECRYGDHAGSCFALDFEHALFGKHGGTLRDYYLAQYSSRQTQDNPLATCLGVCGWLLVREDDVSYLLVVERTARLASLELSRGPSVAGAVDFASEYTDLGQLITASLAAETKEELDLDPADYRSVPLAFAREIFRGEKPQLFCVMETELPRGEIGSRLERLHPDRREFDGFEFVRLESQGSLPNSWVKRLNHEALMNYYLLEEYMALLSSQL